jgi:hypothetical protein
MHAHDLDLVSKLPAAPQQGVARVLESHAEGWLIALNERRIPAKRAASCLLEPAPGDRVWAVGQSGEGFFVIAVLERDPEVATTETKLQLDGDVTLAAGGRMTLSAPEGVRLTTTAKLELHADELDVAARSGRMVLSQAAVVASSLLAHLRKSTVVGQTLDTLVERVTQHSKTSYRSISELDHVHASNLDYRADGLASVHGKQTLMTAQELVKVDGGQIHLG